MPTFFVFIETVYLKGFKEVLRYTRLGYLRGNF